MSHDFEVVQSRRSNPGAEQGKVTVVSPAQSSRIEAAIADNFNHIIDLVANIVEIGRMKVQSDAVIKQMEETRKQLLAEAKAYAIKKSADTDEAVRKMQVLRDMMRDFYQYNNNARLSGEDFSRIISEVINNADKL